MSRARGDTGHWEAHPRYKNAGAPSARAFAEPKAACIARALELTGEETILDVGAGTGHLTAAFLARGHDVTSVDLSRAMLARNPARARIRADALRLPFPDDSFDLAVEASVLHHVADPVQVLKEMARVSRTGVAAIEPNRNHPPMFLFSLLVRAEWPALRFTKKHLKTLAREALLEEVLLETRGWVYQNKTPAALAGWLGRREKKSSLAAYVVGAFKERQ